MLRWRGLRESGCIIQLGFPHSEREPRHWVRGQKWSRPKGRQALVREGAGQETGISPGCRDMSRSAHCCAANSVQKKLQEYSFQLVYFLSNSK